MSSPKVSTVKTTLTKIPVGRVVVDDEVACRPFHPDSEGFESICADMAANGFREDKPLKVFKRGSDFVLINGRHRLEAAKRTTGITHVLAVIASEAEADDALIEGFHDNTSATGLTFVEEATVVERTIQSLKNDGEKANDSAVAETLGKRPKWVRQRRLFGLFPEDWQKAIRNEEIVYGHMASLYKYQRDAMEDESKMDRLLGKALNMSAAAWNDLMAETSSNPNQRRTKKGKTKKMWDSLSESEQEAVSGTRSAPAILGQYETFKARLEVASAKLADAAEAREEFIAEHLCDDGTMEEMSAAKLEKIEASVRDKTATVAILEGSIRSLLWVLKMNPDAEDFGEALAAKVAIEKGSYKAKSKAKAKGKAKKSAKKSGSKKKAKKAKRASKK